LNLSTHFFPSKKIPTQQESSRTYFLASFSFQYFYFLL
jgi:hypothetical protein